MATDSPHWDTVWSIALLVNGGPPLVWISSGAPQAAITWRRATETAGAVDRHGFVPVGSSDTLGQLGCTAA